MSAGVISGAICLTHPRTDAGECGEPRTLQVVAASAPTQNSMYCGSSHGDEGDGWNADEGAHTSRWSVRLQSKGKSLPFD